MIPFITSRWRKHQRHRMFRKVVEGLAELQVYYKFHVDSDGSTTQTPVRKGEIDGLY